MSDSAVLPSLLQQLPADEALESLRGDGAYDTQPVYEAVIQRGCRPIIPPRKNARTMPSRIAMQRSSHVGVWVEGCESVEWLSPAKPGEDKEELHQTTGREGYVQNL